jgi:general secretion pathway protein A
LASKEVVSDAQFVVNQRGIEYKNFIPATFGSQAAQKFSARSKVTIKQIALDSRNLHNAPDAHERIVLLRLSTQSMAGQPFKVMPPLYYSED